MATQAYYTWDAKGRPYRVAGPVAYLEGYCRKHGVTWLGDIGSDDPSHLQNAYPQDHCPYSYTGHPYTLPLTTPVDGQSYWVCAGDMANAKGLGEALLRDARAGRLPWLKYINFDNQTWSSWDGFQDSEWNADTHIHVSVRDDNTSLLADLTGYDPLGADMALTSSEHATLYALDARVRDGLVDGDDTTTWTNSKGEQRTENIWIVAQVKYLTELVVEIHNMVTAWAEGQQAAVDKATATALREGAEAIDPQAGTNG